MKISLFHRGIRRKFVPTLAMGPVVWRCTTGRANHAVEWNFSFHAHKDPCPSYGPWLLLPTIKLRPWHKSVLASMDLPGTATTAYHSISFDIAFLCFEAGFSIGRSTNKPWNTIKS